MTKRHWIVIGIALTVAVVGIGIGTSAATRLPSGIACGAPWGDGPAVTSIFADLAEECAEALSGRKITAWVLTAGGLAVALVVGIVGYLSQRKDVDA